MSDPFFAPVDATQIPRFADVATFMRTRRHDIDDRVDVGLVGVPFDLGVNFRSGPREGPEGVRKASRLIRARHPVTDVRPYEMCNVADLGDAPVNPLDKDASIDGIQAFFEKLKAANIRPIAIGGDHTIPTPIIRALATSAEPVGIFQIDSHADVLDEVCGTRVNHATFMRRCHEEGLIDASRVVQLGLRGSRFGDDDLKYGAEAGFTQITIDQYEDMGRATAIETINKTLGDGPVYITLDIDGLDPAFCPGTPVPEIGGLIPRDAQVILRSIANRNIVGADICEVAPCYDPTGITCVTAANMMFEMLCLIAQSVEANR